MNIKQSLTTKNVSAGRNTCEYICLHHTASGYNTIKWVLNQLTVWPVSCHFVVDTNGDIYRIWQLNQILWHAWVSAWDWKKDMNKYSIWIEIIWPLPWFTDEQRKSVREICEFLMQSLNIPKENIIRHKDISPGRKTDVHDSFWNNEYKTFKDYQDSYSPNNNLMEDNTTISEFKSVFDKEKPAWYKQIFSDLSGKKVATIEDVKLLIEIANIRNHK